MQILQRLQKPQDGAIIGGYANMPKVFTIAIGAACLYAGSVDMFYGSHWSLTGMPMLFVGMLFFGTIERKRV